MKRFEFNQQRKLAIAIGLCCETDGDITNVWDKDRLWVTEELITIYSRGFRHAIECIKIKTNLENKLSQSELNEFLDFIKQESFNASAYEHKEELVNLLKQRRKENNE